MILDPRTTEELFDDMIQAWLANTYWSVIWPLRGGPEYVERYFPHLRGMLADG